MAAFDWVNDAVRATAKDVIRDHHQDLDEARICYLFRTDEWTNRGRTVHGTAQVLTGSTKFLTGFDVQITLNLAAWEAHDYPWREALLDHELSHIKAKSNKDGDLIYFSVGHDFEDFLEIVERRGFWTDALKGVKQQAVIKQERFDFDGAATSGETAAPTAEEPLWPMLDPAENVLPNGARPEVLC